ncbi:uncharacterized protein CTRU02_211012 [Colletotrichum truncatum]|uniref:Uncharacterized protein n=1 Tax=Colletotrichum truncatum TaxID=5467 RepID=A0ACC3YQL6_COLTU|nr:uncharacterized protein CTRU02_01793 [Colletotrichum truncatum]KAF6798922.1 hypothetical protein CTRU02_01793 [Colletotrichum truncatum]
MSYSKRSRAAYEADLHGGNGIHVTYGTALPPLDPGIRDDGSYIPLHKQEVRDDRGRRRLHGAFTGGWSAGYFNTVGSKEGWTPSTFVSTRTSRRKDDPKTPFQRPEDYMDEEDLADVATAKDIQTTEPFAVLGVSEKSKRHDNILAGLMPIHGDTMGLKLLRRMGWKDGQGIGPKVLRKARLGVSTEAYPPLADETFLFAPKDVDVIAFSRKADRRGLGYGSETAPSGLSGFDSVQDSHAFSRIQGEEASEDDDDDNDNNDTSTGISKSLFFTSRKTKKVKDGQRGGFGVGVLNDTGSDDDDPYEMGPRISYNRTLGVDKAKKKKKPMTVSISANPGVRSKPVFTSKSGLSAKASGSRKCLDGKPPLDGFTLGRSPESRSSGQPTELHPYPVIPVGWLPRKRTVSPKEAAAYVSTADAAKETHHDPKSRAAVLGEYSLPGKSVFDYMTVASRERLAIASGKSNLPPAKGEIPADHGRRADQQLQDSLRNLPNLTKETAIAAMSRGTGARGPYADDDAKRGRYRLYLQNAAGFGGSPVKPSDMTDNEFVKELLEFYGCAQLFKPMNGLMATRFTTASAGSRLPADEVSGTAFKSSSLHPATTQRPQDAAEEAAKMSMYGRLTRLAEDFFPARLLCKRFNVRPPTHMQQDSEVSIAATTQSPLPVDATVKDTPPYITQRTATLGALGPGELLQTRSDMFTCEETTNEAIRPNDEVFKAIFGDSSDEGE